MRAARAHGASLMRMLPVLGMLGLAGVVTNSLAAERIFADGFEPCCRLGGEVTGLTASGLVLHLAAGVVSENMTLVANDGSLQLYTFTSTATAGGPYAVTVTAQPGGLICTLSNASGIVVSPSIENINADCVAGPPGLIWDGGAWDDANWQ